LACVLAELDAPPTQLQPSAGSGAALPRLLWRPRPRGAAAGHVPPSLQRGLRLQLPGRRPPEVGVAFLKMKGQQQQQQQHQHQQQQHQDPLNLLLDERTLNILSFQAELTSTQALVVESVEEEKRGRETMKSFRPSGHEAHRDTRH